MRSRGAAALLLSVTATCLSPFPAFALQPEAGDATPGRSIETPADRFGFGQGEQIQFSVGTEEQTVTFRAELPTGPATPWRFSLIGSAPLDNDDDAMPESLDALANGTRLTLRAGHFWLGAAAPSQKCPARSVSRVPFASASSDSGIASSSLSSGADPISEKRHGVAGPVGSSARNVTVCSSVPTENWICSP